MKRWGVTLLTFCFLSNATYGQSLLEQQSAVLQSIRERNSLIETHLIAQPPSVKENFETGMLEIAGESVGRELRQLVEEENADRVKLSNIRMDLGYFQSLEEAGSRYGKTRETQVSALFPQVLLRFDGSKVFSGLLGPELASAYLESRNYREISVASFQSLEGQVVEVRGKNSSGRIDSIQFCLDLTDSAPFDSDITVLGGEGKDFPEGAANDSVVEIARSGIGVVVNPFNPVDELSEVDLQRIFTGEIERWSRIDGGESLPIQIALPRLDRGIVQSLLSGLNTGLSDSLQSFDNDHELESFVFTNKGAIAILPMPTAVMGENKPLRIKFGEHEGKRATILTVEKGEYPLIQNLAFLIRNESNDEATRFLEFIQSPSGASVIRGAGFVPVQ